ncbi:MAG: hypothetical protein OXT09_36240 [Myxococcales bacterium]|nr:hypothetical protein [Myxococcales bacterium]
MALRIVEADDARANITRQRAYRLLALNMTLAGAAIGAARWRLTTDPGWTMLLSLALGICLYLSIKGALHSHLAVSPRPYQRILPDFVADARNIAEGRTGGKELILDLLTTILGNYRANDTQRAIAAEHAGLALHTSMVHTIVTVVIVAGVVLLPQPPPTPSTEAQDVGEAQPMVIPDGTSTPGSTSAAAEDDGGT